VSTRAIRTSTSQDACDVCGRTLLRGEQAQIYLAGGSRRSVCELCTSRALHGGWVREGTVPEFDEASARPDRRRSLLHRLRTRAAPATNGHAQDASEETEPARPEPARSDPPPRPAPRRAPELPAVGREPRHVRAVPTSVEHRISSAVSLFNGSEHPRTVASITRSLGLPTVSVHPSDPVASIVNVIVAWELCWYRYEVDLSDEVPSVRSAGQGYELDELSVLERQVNATADDRGQLALGGY
jgi:hypothetical protein